LEQKLNNQDKRRKGSMTRPVSNPYKSTGRGWRQNRRETVEKHVGVERVAVNEREATGVPEEEMARKETPAGRAETPGVLEEAGDRNEEMDEEVVVTMEEGDTVSPLSSRQSTVGGRSKSNNQEGWKTVGRKEKRDTKAEAESKANTVGVKMVRIGNTGTTGYIPRDVSHFFTMLKRIDPTAVVLNSKNKVASATTMEEMEKMSAIEYKGFLDMRTDNWGGPTENKEKTVWMCYIATDLMSPTLQQLREDKQMQDYLRAGDITMQYTKLHESNSRVAFHIANKDPKYTNRNDLEERLSKHLNHYSDKEIPIHVLNMATTGRNFNTRMCTAVVGGKDTRKVESILKEHPFQELELIPFSWKFQDIAGYTRRLKEHEGVLKLSRAIKIEEMNVSDEFEDLKLLMEGDPAHTHVIDVFPATHASRTGVVYVQYINEHRAAVMQMVQDIIKKIKDKREEEQTIVPFPHGPKIANTNGSVAPTIQTNKTNKSSINIPSSKYGGLLNPNQVTSTVKHVPWAISVNNKSFLDAVRGTATETMESDSETDTFRSGNSGRKSIREAELEDENRQLTKQLNESKINYQQLLKHMEANERKRQEDKRKHEKEMEELRAMVLNFMKNKKDNESESNSTTQGSTPKRKKRTNPNVDSQEHNPLTGATLEEEFPEAALCLEEQWSDEEPTTLEEGLDLT
jgi:hypothetical protein